MPDPLSACRGGYEARGHRLGGIELGGGAEFLYADGRDGEFLAGDEGQGIETIAAHHAEPVGKVGGGDVLVQYLAHQRYQVVHIGVWFVNVVKHIVALRDILQHKLYESHDVAHVGHALHIGALAHHEKLAAGNLLEQVIDVATVAQLLGGGGEVQQKLIHSFSLRSQWKQHSQSSRQFLS